MSVGGGAEGVLGNRGKLWTGGTPLIQVGLQYWFDFHMALSLGFYTVQQAYDTTINNLGHVDVTMNHLGVDFKYYFDTRDLSAPISFANPYVILGAGAYNKIESSNQLGTGVSNNDTEFGLSGGVGLEFAIIPDKTYFDVEGKFHWVTFTDTYSSEFAPAGIPDLTGLFWTLTGSVLFTW